MELKLNSSRNNALLNPMRITPVLNSVAPWRRVSTQVPLRRVSVPEPITITNSGRSKRNRYGFLECIRNIFINNRSIHDINMARNKDTDGRCDDRRGSYHAEEVQLRDHVDHTASYINISIEHNVPVTNGREEWKHTETHLPLSSRCNVAHGGRGVSVDIDGVNAGVDAIRSPKLLLVDDSQLCRNMLARALVSRCRVCEEAEDGRQAVEMMRASIEAGDPYDVVLMDLQMPHMNGPEATRRIRRELGMGES